MNNKEDLVDILLQLKLLVQNRVTYSKYKKLIINVIQNKVVTDKPLKINNRLWIVQVNTQYVLYYNKDNRLTILKNKQEKIII